MPLPFTTPPIPRIHTISQETARDRVRGDQKALADTIKDFTWEGPPDFYAGKSWFSAEEAARDLAIDESTVKAAADGIRAIVRGASMFTVAKNASGAGLPEPLIREMLRRGKIMVNDARLRRGVGVQKSSPPPGQGWEPIPHPDENPGGFRRKRHNGGYEYAYPNPAQADDWTIRSTPADDEHLMAHADHAAAEPHPGVAEHFGRVRQKASQHGLTLTSVPHNGTTRQHIRNLEGHVDSTIAARTAAKAAAKEAPVDEGDNAADDGLSPEGEEAPVDYNDPGSAFETLVRRLSAELGVPDADVEAALKDVGDDPEGQAALIDYLKENRPMPVAKALARAETEGRVLLIGDRLCLAARGATIRDLLVKARTGLVLLPSKADPSVNRWQKPEQTAAAKPLTLLPEGQTYHDAEDKQNIETLPARIAAFEDKHRLSSREYAQGYSRDGRLVGASDPEHTARILRENPDMARQAGVHPGREFEATRGMCILPESVTMGHDLRGGTFTHNHPSGSPLSLQDIIAADGMELQTIRATAPTGAWVATVKDPSVDWYRFGRIYGQFFQFVQQEASMRYIGLHLTDPGRYPMPPDGVEIPDDHPYVEVANDTFRTTLEANLVQNARVFPPGFSYRFVPRGGS